MHNFFFHFATKSANPVVIKYKLRDNADQSEAEGKYFLTLHDEWEKPTVNTAKTWDNGTHPGQTHRTGEIVLNVPRIDGPQTDKTWTFANYTAGLKAVLSGSFGADFKLKDWLNIGGQFETEASLEITAEYGATAPLLNLAAGQSAIPCIKYIVKTDHKLVERFDLSGWDRNTARSDGKWEQSADLPIPLNDISANWKIVPSGQPTP